MKDPRPRPRFPLGDFRIPDPPAWLRGRVLERAGEALGRPPRPDLWNRIWESRALRLGWALSIGALLLANAALRPPARRPVAQAAARRDLRDSATLARIGGLPRIETGARPLVGGELWAQVEHEDSGGQRRFGKDGRS